MNHSAMREFFKKFSGKYALSDAAITQLLNQGVEFLSPKLIGHYKEVMLPVALPSGDNLLDISQYFIAVQKIWYINSSGTWSAITEHPNWDTFVETYPLDGTTGDPTYWTLSPNMATIEMADITTSFTANEKWSSSMFAGEARLVVLFNKITTSDVSLRVKGSARLIELDEDDDFNMLTVQDPILLSHAALYFHEIKLRQYDEAQKMLGLLDVMIGNLDITSTLAEIEHQEHEIDA